MSRFDPFAGAGPRWWSIEAHRPFLEDLAAGVLDWLGADAPETLSDAVILLPNRRAARAFTEALTLLSGDRPVLLPQVRPLGDLEEDEPPFAPGELELDLKPAISPLKRRFELARLVAAHHGGAVEPLRALEMAEALAAFLDSCQIEEVADPGRVADLVEADLAEHWRSTAAFLAVAVEEWPRRLDELGLSDPSARRVTLLKRLAEAWDERPPAFPVIAAGSTGTVPAAAAVLGAVARAPSGCVVLPGLDRDLSQGAWDQIAGDDGEQHPQGALKRLIGRHGVDRAQVRAWPARDTGESARLGRARRRLIAEALKPPASTADWTRAIAEMRKGGGDPVAEGLEGLTGVTARTEEAAAAVAAVLMREGVETAGRTVALVTPDPLFARRVQARLGRWGLMADSSAGSPLSETPAGVRLGQLAQLAKAFGAVPVLGILKHPWTTLAGPDEIEALEREGLRGAGPADWDAVRRRLEANRNRNGKPRKDEDQARIDTAHDLVDRLEGVLSALTGMDAAKPADWARAISEAAEALGEGAEVWRGPDGASAARLMAGLMTDGAEAGVLNGAAFAELLGRLMAAEVVRTGGDAHPRLRILGAIEARLVRADRVILAGLEEGVWPRGGGTDPFLSRPMRKTLGLPPPERRIGLSAHDFAQIACAPEVYLLHTERRDNQPSVKSRWLWRLETLVRGAFPDAPRLPQRPDLHDLARRLDAPDADPPRTLKPAQRPAPTPPTAARPTKMSVTRVEEWVRDPYATYARFVLNLHQMERPDERVDARLRGTAIHTALEAFARDWETLGEAGAQQRFLDRYLAELAAAGMTPAALARETALGARMADWVTGFERDRRARRPHVALEAYGEWSPVEGFLLTARADRMEVAEGRLSVMDYKTGAPPTKKQVESGFSSQLSLTAAIAREGGFGAVLTAEPHDLLYVRLTGRDPAGEIMDRNGEAGAAALADEAVEGLRKRIRQYASPGQPYRSRIAPQFAQARVSDYDHLARVAEWSTAAEGDE
ncbi:MAG: double-strand break repair protein AddB [Brevundimonas sp.]